MSEFFAQHPYLASSLIVIALLSLDNMVMNICKAIAVRKGDWDDELGE